LVSESLLPALQGLYGSKTLRRVAGTVMSAFGIWMGTWMRERVSKEELAAAEQRCVARVELLARNTDPARVDERVKVTEARASHVESIVVATAKRQEEASTVDVNLYLRLVSLQAADAEPNRALKARAADAARKEFLLLVSGGAGQAMSAQRAAEIVLESPIPGADERRPRRLR
jgi:hypothetical protein